MYADTNSSVNRLAPKLWMLSSAFFVMLTTVDMEKEEMNWRALGATCSDSSKILVFRRLGVALAHAPAALEELAALGAVFIGVLSTGAFGFAALFVRIRFAGEIPDEVTPALSSTDAPGSSPPLSTRSNLRFAPSFRLKTESSKSSSPSSSPTKLCLQALNWILL